MHATHKYIHLCLHYTAQQWVHDAQLCTFDQVDCIYNNVEVETLEVTLLCPTTCTVDVNLLSFLIKTSQKLYTPHNDLLVLWSRLIGEVTNGLNSTTATCNHRWTNVEVVSLLQKMYMDTNGLTNSVKLQGVQKLCN